MRRFTRRACVSIISRPESSSARIAEAYREHGDAARFAEEYIPTIRSWNESIFLNGLCGERPLEERQQIIEDYYGTYAAMVRDNPAGHGMDYVHAYTVISKTG